MSHVEKEFRSVDQLLKEIKELRERGDYFKNIIDSADKGIWVINNDLESIFVNYRMAELLGCTIDEVVGESILKFVDEENWDIFRARLIQCKAGCKERFDFKFRRKDGRELWTLAGISPLLDRQGRKIGINGTFADITERKLMEMTLQEMKDNLMKAQHIARLGSWVRDLKTNKIDCSGELAEILGTPDEPITPDDIFKLVQFDDKEKFIRTAESAIERGGSFKTDVRIVPRDGRERYCHLEADVIKDKWGRPIKVVGILQDITERKQAEEALKEAKSQANFFIDVISHDIGNMNHAILGYLELAQDVLPAEGCHKELIERPMDIINKSTRLIKDVRMLRQVRGGETEMKKMDAGDMLSKAVANTAHNGDVRINYSPMSGYEVMANESLHDAFSDIINNFIEYSKRPLVIDIEAGKSRENGKEYYRFAFEDNGPGIPDALKRKLLGTWGLNEKPVRRSLGFQFIKALIDAYHGKVWMEDRVPGDHSKGVKIVVMLPAAE